MLETLVEGFAPEGGLVLDPFAESGSSLLAVRDAGRRFLGMELDYRYYQTARRTEHQNASVERVYWLLKRTT